MKLLICGDYIVNKQPLLRAIRGFEGEEQLFGTLLPHIRCSDVSIFNGELPVTAVARSVTLKGYGWRLKSAPESLAPVAKAGFTHATLAANHAYDYGAEGLRDTLEALRNAKITPVGAGITADEAGRPLRIDEGDARVTILNYTENDFSVATEKHGGANPLHLVDNARQIAAERAQGRHVIVIIHGGTDYCKHPSPRMVKQYRFYVEQGASAVIGHHTHLVAAHEVYLGAPIFYSLGTLVYALPLDPEFPDWLPVLAVSIEIAGDCLDFTPIVKKFDLSRFVMVDLSEEEQRFYDSRMEGLQRALQDPAQLKAAWSTCVSRTTTEVGYFSMLLRQPRWVYRLCKKTGLLEVYRKWMLRKLQNTATSAALWNLTRCETWLDFADHYYRKYIDRP